MGAVRELNVAQKKIVVTTGSCDLLGFVSGAQEQQAAMNLAVDILSSIVGTNYCFFSLNTYARDGSVHTKTRGKISFFLHDSLRI